jgi:hypothetical protein
VEEIPQLQQWGLRTLQLQMVGSPASSNAMAWYLRNWLGRLLLWTPMPLTCDLKGFWSCWRDTRLRISIMQMKQASFQLAARPNTAIEKRDLPWRKKCKGATHSATVHKQQWLRQTSTLHYWKVHETMVFKNVKTLPMTYYVN